MDTLNNTINIVGMVDGVRIYQGTHYYDVILPAKDAYSKPANVQVSSDKKLANKGDEIDVLCELVSYYRTFTTKDGEQGRDYTTRFHAL